MKINELDFLETLDAFHSFVAELDARSRLVSDTVLLSELSEKEYYFNKGLFQGLLFARNIRSYLVEE